MNFHLKYQETGQSYSENLSNFEVSVSRTSSGKRVKVEFRQKENGRGYASFSLPRDKAELLAHAIRTVSAGNTKPVQFDVVEETAGAKPVAA